MTSIVDTSVKNFNHTMAGAPPISSTSGALVTLLDALLVNGFDLKTASSLTIAGGVASLAFTGSHSAQLDGVILIAGVTGPYAALNGEQKVSAVGTGVVRFSTNAADGTAAGTITFKMAPAGWEKVYAGANKAVYRSLDPASTQMLLRVDDTGTTSARVVGYESMSDVDTGISPFPTAAQISGGGYWVKTTVAGTAVAPWVLHADSRAFFFTVQPGVVSNVAATGGITRFFGDFIAYRPGGDAFACGLNYSLTTAATGQGDGAIFAHIAGGGAATAQTASPRSYTGLGSSWLMYAYPYTGANTAVSGIDATFGNFPGDVDGSLQLSEKYFTNSVTPRGRIPGAYHVPQGALINSFKILETVQGTGLLAGRTLQAVTTWNPNTSQNSPVTTTTAGVAFLDVTGPWR